ncbi:hypothetical protein [Streptomyces sp. NPDC004726]
MRSIAPIEDLGPLARRHCVDDSPARAMARVIRTDLTTVDATGLLSVSLATEGSDRTVGAADGRRARSAPDQLGTGIGTLNDQRLQGRRYRRLWSP